MTLRVRRIENGDVPFGRQASAYASGGEAALQSVAQNLRSLANEWFLDSSGVDWFGTILRKGTTDTIALAYIQQAILASNGVDSLANLVATFDRNKRAFTVTARVRTVDGIQTFSGVYP